VRRSVKMKARKQNCCYCARVVVVFETSAG
jgi:hypothetical protein